MTGLHSNDTPTSPGFDFGDLIDLAGDDPDFLGEFIELFEQDSSRLVVEVVQASVRSDGPSLQRSAHALKGLLSHFGESRAFEICQALETSGQAGNLEGAEERASTLAAEVALIRQALADLAH